MGQRQRRSLLLAVASALIVSASVHAQPPMAPPATPPSQPSSPYPPSMPLRPGPMRDPIVPPAEAGTGIIRGRVVALDGGTPLRRVQVRLMGGNLRQGRAAISDAQGQFAFTDLAAGPYTLSATKGGYVSLQYGQRTPNDTGRLIDLADGQTVAKIEIALPRGAVITGRVVDDGGEPLADVPIEALQYRMLNGRKRLLPSGRTALTNDIGQYRLYGLVAGEYYLRASPNASAMFLGAASKGTPNIGEAQRLAVAVGQEIKADMQLSAIATRLVRISGSVTQSNGKPASSGFVALRNRNANSFGPMTSGGGNVIRPDGTFELAGVAAGSYALIANINLMDGQTQTREVATMPVTVSGTDISGLRVVTVQGITVSGRLAYEGAGAPDPASIKQMRAICMPVDPDGAMMAGSAPMPADDQGQFQIKGITARCLINVFGMPSPWTLKSVTLDGQEITDRAIEPAGKAIDGVVITLTSGVTTLSGAVQDAQHQPVKDYTVIVFPEDKARWLPELGARYFRRARPDKAGAFRITGLPAGRYLVAAFDNLEQGAELDPDFLAKIQSIATKTELNDGDTQNLTLKISAR